MLGFDAPWALLLLLVVLPATAAFGRERLRRLPGGRGPVALALRLLVLALIVAAMAGPEWRTPRQRVSVFFVVDASASVGAAGQHAAMDWAARAVAAAGPLDQAGLILAGAAPRLAVPLAHYHALPDPADDPTAATNLAAGLRLGLSLLPGDSPGRLVLLSDGRDTAGGLDAARALAVTRGIPVDTVAVQPPRLRDVAVRAFDAPASVRVGDQAALRITLFSSVATQATLTLWVDGAAAQQSISLPAGISSLRTEQRLDAAGLHTFRVQVSAPGDAIPQNNSLDAATVAAPPGRVLLAVNDPRGATALATALARARLRVTAALPGALPRSAAAYDSYDAVVLDDVPASALSHTQQVALRDAVYHVGLGLLAVGGPNSFGQGAYAHTPLEDALPVYSVSTPRRSSAPVALMLVIDKSGSMSDQVDGVAKIDMVKVAATSALDRLDVGDAVGVLAFDDTNHWIVPFHILQGAADKANIRRQISTLTGDGDTYIYPALSAAEAAVLKVPTIYRHVVLLTDGQGEDANFNALIQRMHREHITLSTIGVGQDVVQDELKRWAKLGGGLFHYVSDPHDIPHIIVSETRYGTAGSAEVTGHIHLGVASASTLLRALAGQPLPGITTYDSTIPKASAQVAVQSGTADPVLSSWQFGLGRVVAWTSDASPSATSGWSGNWSPSRLPGFWTDLAHWSLRGVDSTGVPQLSVGGGQIVISTRMYARDGGFDDTASPRVRLTAPDGSARVAELALTAPGYYQASVPLAGQGVYAASFVRDDRGTPAPDKVAALVVPYPAEYADDGVDQSLLTQLSASTGGAVLSRPADAFAHDGLPFTTLWLPLWPYVLALALLLFPVEIGVRLLLPADPRYEQRI